MILAAALLLLAQQPLTVKGTGKVAMWTINSASTELTVKYKSGEQKKNAIKDLVLEDGEFFLTGGVVLAENRLFVSHEAGLYIIDETGTIIKKEATGIPKIRIVEGKKVTVAKENSDKRPAAFKRARGWNTKTVALAEMNRPFDQVTLVTSDLELTHVVRFKGERIEFIEPAGPKGWKLKVYRADKVRTVLVSNEGSVTFPPK